jgi:hypothetical protein
MEQMMERLLAEIRVNQAKMDTSLREIIAEMTVWRKELKVRRKATEVYPERTETRIKTGTEGVKATNFEANPGGTEVVEIP